MSDTNVKVVVRCRPLSKKEIDEGSKTIFSIEDEAVCLINPNTKESDEKTNSHKFGFDHVYGVTSTQAEVYHSIGAPILDKAFAGFNGTIFAYGQTGSGKSFSMSGIKNNEALEGIIPRFSKDLFSRIEIEIKKNPAKKFLVMASYYEIYNEIISDLLVEPQSKSTLPSPSSNGNSSRGLSIKQHPVLGVYVHGLREIVCEDINKISKLMQSGNKVRTTASTMMNSESSRSHSVFTLKVHQKDSKVKENNVFAKVNLVDLAGSERAKRTGATGSVLKEGANINKSLSALSNVINVLVHNASAKRKKFVPYRNSKLTRVLQESLGGNSLCCMLAAISPADSNYNETMSTLRYASRAKSIKVQAKRNDEDTGHELLKGEIERLRKQLAMQEAQIVTDTSQSSYTSQIEELEEMMKQTWEDKAALSQQYELEAKKHKETNDALNTQMKLERERHRQLLEDKCDVEFTLRDINSKLKHDLINRWIDQIMKIKDCERTLNSQQSLLSVYKNTLISNMSEFWSLVIAHESLLSEIFTRKNYTDDQQGKTSNTNNCKTKPHTTDPSSTQIMNCYLSLQRFIDSSCCQVTSLLGEVEVLFNINHERYHLLDQLYEYIEIFLSNIENTDNISSTSKSNSSSISALVHHNEIDKEIIIDVKDSLKLCLNQIQTYKLQMNIDSHDTLHNLFGPTLYKCIQILSQQPAPTRTHPHSFGDSDSSYNNMIYTHTDAVHDNNSIEEESIIYFDSNIDQSILHAIHSNLIPPKRPDTTAATSTDYKNNVNVVLSNLIDLLNQLSSSLSGEVGALDKEATSAKETLQGKVGKLLRENKQQRLELLKLEGNAIKQMATKLRMEERIQDVEDLLRKTTNSNELLKSKQTLLKNESLSLNQVIINLSQQIQVLNEDLDESRSQEEKYYFEIQSTNEELMWLRSGYIDLTDRLNEKMDEMMELQNSLDYWKGIAESTTESMIRLTTPRIVVAAPSMVSPDMLIGHAGTDQQAIIRTPATSENSGDNTSTSSNNRSHTTTPTAHDRESIIEDDIIDKSKETAEHLSSSRILCGGISGTSNDSTVVSGTTSVVVKDAPATQHKNANGVLETGSSTIDFMEDENYADDFEDFEDSDDEDENVQMCK